MLLNILFLDICSGHLKNNCRRNGAFITEVSGGNVLD